MESIEVYTEEDFQGKGETEEVLRLVPDLQDVLVNDEVEQAEIEVFNRQPSQYRPIMTIDQMIEKVGEWSNNVSQSTLIAHHPLNVKSKENGRGSKAELKYVLNHCLGEATHNTIYMCRTINGS